MRSDTAHLPERAEWRPRPRRGAVLCWSDLRRWTASSAETARVAIPCRSAPSTKASSAPAGSRRPPILANRVILSWLPLVLGGPAFGACPGGSPETDRRLAEGPSERPGSFTDGGRRRQRTVGPAAQPRPVHVRLVYTAGPLSPVSVVFTTTSRIQRLPRPTSKARTWTPGVSVAGNPSIGVSSDGRRYQAYASSSVVKHLHIGHHNAVTIAIGHGAAERHVTRQITLRRATVKGIRPAGDASPARAFPASRGRAGRPGRSIGPASRAVPS